VSISTYNLAQSLLCNAVLRLCHWVFYTDNRSIRLNVGSVYGRNKNIVFRAQIFTTLYIKQSLFLKSFCTVFFLMGKKNVLSANKILFVPIR